MRDPPGPRIRHPEPPRVPSSSPCPYRQRGTSTRPRLAPSADHRRRGLRHGACAARFAGENSAALPWQEGRPASPGGRAARLDPGRDTPKARSRRPDGTDARTYPTRAVDRTAHGRPRRSEPSSPSCTPRHACAWLPPDRVAWQAPSSMHSVRPRSRPDRPLRPDDEDWSAPWCCARHEDAAHTRRPDRSPVPARCAARIS